MAVNDAEKQMRMMFDELIELKENNRNLTDRVAGIQ